MHEQSWKVQKPGPAKVEDWRQNATTRLNCMLCNWSFEIKADKFFANFHMKNCEGLYLLVREIAPNVKAVVQFRKIRELANRERVRSERRLEAKTCLDKGTKAD